MYVITTIIVICVVLLFLRGFYLSYLDSLKEAHAKPLEHLHPNTVSVPTLKPPVTIK